MTMEVLSNLEMWFDGSSNLREAALSLSILTLLTYFIFRMSIVRKDLTTVDVPEPPALPIIGHLHLMGKLPHQVLMKLARQYGPLLSVRLGSFRFLVVSSADMAREVLKTQDAVWASRPHIIFGELFFYKTNDMILQPLNDYWRKMRKIYIAELMSTAHVEKQMRGRHDSTMRLLNSLLASQQDNKAVDITAAVRDASFYQMTKLVFGTKANTERSGGGKTLCEILHELAVIDFLSLGECFPYLKWLDLDRVESRLKKLHREFDEFLSEQLETRQRQLQDDPDDDSTDFSRALLSMLHSKDESGLTLINIKGALTDMATAGIETTGSTMSAIITEIMRNPEVKLKLVQELDDVVGRERMVVESDLVNLKYLKMVLKEAMRLHPVIPLMVAHMSLAPSVVNGYHIPAETPLFVNLYAIHRDPSLWEDPLTFKPERFLHSSIDVRGQHFQLLPFGSGRRMCPGMNTAMVTMEIVLARLFHSLDIQLPPGMKPEDVDLSEKTGTATTLVNPVKVVVAPRFPPEFYRTS